MTDYHITREQYGRTETIIDLPRFTADLAAELGGIVTKKEDREFSYIRLDDLELHVYANGYWSHGKVHISAIAADIPPGDRPYQDGTGTYRLPDARVSPDRPMATIAKDIKRRVIDAAQTPLANIKKYVAQRSASRNSLTENVAKIRAAVPEITETDRGSDDAYNRSLWWSGQGVYMYARAYAGGDVGIDRIGNVSLEAFIEICDVLLRNAGKDSAAQ